MSNSQVTITLGRNGQRVVKESWGDSGGGRDNDPWFSGSKRSVSESYGSSADYIYGERKRMREEISSRSYASSSRTNNYAADSRLSPYDLRLKLRRKRASRFPEIHKSGYRRNVQNERVSGPSKSHDSPRGNFWSREPSSIRITGPPRERSMASSYSSWPSSGVMARSPESTPKYSARISNMTNNFDELPRPPIARRVDGSRTGRVPLNQPADPYIPRAPIPSVSGITLEPDRLPPFASSSMIRPSQAEGQPLTLNSFLHSVGLEKYSINFQAEEIDMAALKQMRDSDLKELGLPMGPRKKILLTLQGPPRPPAASLPINPIH